MDLFFELMIPFLGTLAGASCVLFMRNRINPLVEKALLGFASGVMVAASVWSLLIPAIEMSQNYGRWAFVPAASGFAVGILFLYGLDKLIPHLHLGGEKPEGIKSGLTKTAMLALAVTLHNIPEGMAVGVVFAGVISGSHEITMAGAYALAVGIAIQNFPEGAIISMPMKSNGTGKKKAFLYGVLSGVVEPIGAFLTILVTGTVEKALPFLLAFAAGAMLFVVVEELIPEASADGDTDGSTLGFAVGFLIMMVLDVALG
ncbi:MAG: ZIP family metal transporter [Bacillus sp. (in: Bacteria)]|nr:ZIP family metal transporter [Bacillus sp. (in: firmicutes)]MCM1426036.1 ZIP family metal transporter [Eubacterium sp.]